MTFIDSKLERHRDYIQKECESYLLNSCIGFSGYYKFDRWKLISNPNSGLNYWILRLIVKSVKKEEKIKSFDLKLTSNIESDDFEVDELIRENHLIPKPISIGVIESNRKDIQEMCEGYLEEHYEWFNSITSFDDWEIESYKKDVAIVKLGGLFKSGGNRLFFFEVKSNQLSITPIDFDQTNSFDKEVDNPAHYQGNVECIDAIASALTTEEFKGFLKGNIIKYTWREKQKNGITDLKKAEWYISRLIKTLEKEV